MRFSNRQLQCWFIDPNPERLKSLLRPEDGPGVRLIERPLRYVPSDAFTCLAPGDILLIDSSHVSKVGSDVNRLFFEILPGLANEVLVHVLDVFFPFEYPRAWVEKGHGWNEAYLVRAFLQYNGAFAIALFSSYLIQRYPAAWRAFMRDNRSVGAVSASTVRACGSGRPRKSRRKMASRPEDLRWRQVNRS